MRTSYAVLILSVSLAACTTSRGASPRSVPFIDRGQDLSVALLLGRSDYNDDWKPLEEIDVVGLDIAQVTEDGTGFELQIAQGDDSGLFLVPAVGIVGIDVTHTTLAGGVRKTWHQDAFHPYVGAGAEVSRAEIDVAVGAASGDVDDTTIGAYVHAGLHIDLDVQGNAFLGLEVRYGGLGADYDFGSGLQGDADYTRISAMLGFRF